MPEIIEPEVVVPREVAEESEVISSDIETTVDSREELTVDEQESLSSALKSGDPSKLSPREKTQYEKEMKTREAKNKNIIIEFYGIDAKNVDLTKTVDENLQKLNASDADKVVKKSQELLKSIDFEKIEKVYKDKLEKNPADKGAKGIASTIAAIAAFGTALAGLIKNITTIAALTAFLQAIADGMSGCYQSNAKKKIKQKLDCQKSDNLEKDCNCINFKNLVKDCINFDTSQDCDTAGYQYIYVKYDIGDVLNHIITAVSDIPDGISKIFIWMKDHWIALLGGFIGLLICIYLFRLAIN